MSRLAQQVIIVLIPPLALIFLVLGTIFLGIATPTEGGAMGAVGALVLAAAQGPADPRRDQAGARLDDAALRLRAVHPDRRARLLADLLRRQRPPLGRAPAGRRCRAAQIGFLIVVNILVFLLAFFLDFFELAFIIVPLLAPAADKLGIDLIWFGVLLGVNMQTSFMHPPFGFALFYLRSVAPRVPYLDRVTGKHDRSRSRPARSTGARCPSSCIQVIMVGAGHRLPADGHALQGRGRSIRRRRDRRAADFGGGDGLGTAGFGARRADFGDAAAAPIGGTGRRPRRRRPRPTCASRRASTGLAGRRAAPTKKPRSSLRGSSRRARRALRACRRAAGSS